MPLIDVTGGARVTAVHTVTGVGYQVGVYLTLPMAAWSQTAGS